MSVTSPVREAHVAPNTIKVLDHGFVTLRNVAGPTRRADQPFDASDVDVANSARMSFDQTDSDRTVEEELRLTRYLYDNLHMTPFESIEVWLEMKLPIFIARQLVRHRTAAINEISGRYVQLPEEFYVPEIIGAKPTDGAKQGQVQGKDLQYWLQDIRAHCEAAFSLYDVMIADGVAPEHARMVLPLNTYTHWLYKMDLRNLLHMIMLRVDSHAQVEAQAYGRACFQLLEQQLPELMSICHDK